MAIVTVSEEQRESLLCSAIEGGSNYWYYLNEDAITVVNEVNADEETPLVTRMWQAIKAGKEIPVTDAEDEVTVLGKISLVSIEKAEQSMADDYAHHFADIVSENEDATTADVWFQLAVMNDVVYG